MKKEHKEKLRQARGLVTEVSKELLLTSAEENALKTLQGVFYIVEAIID